MVTTATIAKTMDQLKVTFWIAAKKILAAATSATFFATPAKNALTGAGAPS